MAKVKRSRRSGKIREGLLYEVSLAMRLYPTIKTQAELATRMHVSTQHLSSFFTEREKQHFSVDFIETLVYTLDLPEGIEDKLLRKFTNSNIGDRKRRLGEIIFGDEFTEEQWLLLPQYNFCSNEELNGNLFKNLEQGTKYVFWSPKDDQLEYVKKLLGRKFSNPNQVLYLKSPEKALFTYVIQNPFNNFKGTFIRTINFYPHNTSPLDARVSEFLIENLKPEVKKLREKV